MDQKWGEYWYSLGAPILLQVRQHPEVRTLRRQEANSSLNFSPLADSVLPGNKNEFLARNLST